MKTEQKYEIIDNVKGISKLQDKSIDLTVTSPPYDNLRTYNGYSWNFERLAQKLYRVTKDGGVIVWVVGDATESGSESGTSFRQALYFKELGFNLHDTMIYMKDGISFPDKNRYQQCFEYMFIFSKGRPKTINLISDRINVSWGRKVTGTDRNPDGTSRKSACYGNDINRFGIRWNVWEYNNTSLNGILSHPAPFPEQLAIDHILSWSDEGDVVLDPFLGSGTTLRACRKTNRNGIGFEINQGYENMIKDRSYINIRSLDAFNTSA